MKKTIALALLALSLSACSTYRGQNLRSSHATNIPLAANDTVRVKSPFEEDAYFLIVDPPDERGRYGVYDLQTGEYALLSGRGLEKVSQ